MRKAIVILFIAFSASAEQKNVKLLTGLTDRELQRTMNMMRASMGTHCDHCHVNHKDKEWDFASDDKPTKKRAREMIQMVMDLNRTTFGGNAVVSCWTCHRGSTRPARLVSLPQTAPPLPTPKPEMPQLPAAKDLVAKYAAALGDASRLSLTRVVKGERTTYQGTSPIELTEKNNESPLALVLPSEFSEDARTTKKEAIGDRDTWVVAQGNQRFYFDAQTGLLARAVLLTPRSIGTIPQQLDYEDYRDAGGAKFPFRIRLSLVDPWMSVTRQYSSVQIEEAK